MKIFLDVGAHKGQTLKIALEEKYGFDKIYCFEPVSECCDVLRTYRDERVTICEYGFWNKNCVMPIYSPGDFGASIFKDKPNRHATIARDAKFVRASDWFNNNLDDDNKVYLKLNCEGSECDILDDLITSGEYRKIDVALIDFDVRKIPSQKHRMNEIKPRLNKLNIPKILYVDELNLGKTTHDYFTHYWLDIAMQI